MNQERSHDIAGRARSIYATRLRSVLESGHAGEFVAIEPDSGDYFVEASFSDAVAQARRSHPDRISFVIRIGHDAALHIGGLSS